MSQRGAWAMKAGIGKVGQRVRLTRQYPAYPEVEAGTMGTIQTIVAQIPGAPEDAFLWHPDSWKHNDMVMPCYSADMEPEAEAPRSIEPIDTGDVVYHAPTKEKWVVALVRGDNLSWAGWPEGSAKLSDCTLIEKATPEAREKLLREMAGMQNTADHRRSE